MGISPWTEVSGISEYLKQIVLQIGKFHPEIGDFGSENPSGLHLFSSLGTT